MIYNQSNINVSDLANPMYGNWPITLFFLCVYPSNLSVGHLLISRVICQVTKNKMELCQYAR